MSLFIRNILLRLSMNVFIYLGVRNDDCLLHLLFRITNKLSLMCSSLLCMIDKGIFFTNPEPLSSNLLSSHVRVA